MCPTELDFAPELRSNWQGLPPALICDRRARAENAMDPTQPIESPPSEDSLEPTAAHFREAARLAAARVRSAITANAPDEQGAPEPEQSDQSKVDAEVFKNAAKEHARTMSGRGPEQEEEEEKEDKKPANKEKKSATTADLDERLHLGARMLRAFESQIQRLERAAHQAHLATTAAAEPHPDTDPTELEARVIALADRVSKAASDSEEVLVTVEAAIERSNSTATALASSLETANALKVGLDESTETLSSGGQEQEARASVILHRLDVVLQAMERKLSRVIEIEKAISARVAHAEQLAQQLAQTPQQEPPIVEIEPLQKKTTPTQPTTPAEPSMVSYGTLSVDPKRLERTQRLKQYQDRA